jgi:hypothetical protein
MSTLKVNSIVPANAGSEDFFLERAHAAVVTDAAGSGATFNQSSITDNGTGDNTHTFSNAFANTNYGHSGAMRHTISNNRSVSQITGSDATGSCQIKIAVESGSSSAHGYDIIWWGTLA